MLSITEDSESPIDWVPSRMDTVVGFGSDVGSVLLAELLLNAGLDNNLQDQFDLEGEEGGYRGVGLGSAELNIFLPGSLGYCEDDR